MRGDLSPSQRNFVHQSPSFIHHLIGSCTCPSSDVNFTRSGVIAAARSALQGQQCSVICRYQLGTQPGLHEYSCDWSSAFITVHAQSCMHRRTIGGFRPATGAKVTGRWALLLGEATWDLEHEVLFVKGLESLLARRRLRSHCHVLCRGLSLRSCGWPRPAALTCHTEVPVTSL